MPEYNHKPNVNVNDLKPILKKEPPVGLRKKVIRKAEFLEKLDESRKFAKQNQIDSHRKDEFDIEKWDIPEKATKLP